MTIFDTETDRYLERLGASRSSGDWDDVLERARRARRRLRVARAGVGLGAVATAAAVLVAVGAPGGVGGTSIVDKAGAAISAPVQAAPGTIEHVLVQYRAESGGTFIEYCPLTDSNRRPSLP